MTLRGEGRFFSFTSSIDRFGHCIIEVEPLPAGSGIIFENAVDPALVPMEFVPAVEEGVRLGAAETNLPFGDMLVRLVGGSHRHDSWDIGYKIAGERAILSTRLLVVHSLGWRTHLMFYSDIAHPKQADYLTIRTPENPTHHWGNFLLFDKPPQPGDLTRWEAAFACEIGPPETTAHKAFGWDTTNDENDDSQAFIDAGYSLNNEVVLAAQAKDLVRPVRFSETVEVRALKKTDAEWEAALQNRIACKGDAFSDNEGYREFKKKQKARYRYMASVGRGNWYGAFLNGRLVGDCGLFWTGDKTLARFQGVGVHPDFRRQGICGAMLWRIAHQAFAQTPNALLVIVADANSPPQAIYQSLGFQVVEKQMSLEKAI